MFISPQQVTCLFEGEYGGSAFLPQVIGVGVACSQVVGQLDAGSPDRVFLVFLGDADYNINISRCQAGSIERLSGRAHTHPGRLVIRTRNRFAADAKFLAHHPFGQAAGSSDLRRGEALPGEVNAESGYADHSPSPGFSARATKSFSVLSAASSGSSSAQMP